MFRSIVETTNPLVKRSRSGVRRYLLAIAAPAISALIRWFLSPLLGDDAVTFLPFAPAVMVSAWYGGFGPGLVATGLGGFLAVLLFAEPRGVFAPQNNSDLVSVGLFAVSGLFISRFIEAWHRASIQAEANASAHRELTRHLQSVREDERERIARELHDELGQLLACAKMEASSLRRLLQKEESPLTEKAESICELMDLVTGSVRALSTELRPRVLDDLGLVAAIDWQIRQFENRTQIECLLVGTPQHLDVGRDQATALFRILQEALTNVARHAGATQVEVSLQAERNGLGLTIQDNGRGISLREIDGRPSLGILGMRERAVALGGWVDVSAIGSTGTRVKAWVPATGDPEPATGRACDLDRP